jgi:hypothetical protein
MLDVPDLLDDHRATVDLDLEASDAAHGDAVGVRDDLGDGPVERAEDLEQARRDRAVADVVGSELAARLLLDHRGREGARQLVEVLGHHHPFIGPR